MISFLKKLGFYSRLYDQSSINREMSSSETRAQKKQPPSPISSLPEEIFVDIVARVSRSYYPTLSQVSRRFRSLVASPELYARRSVLRRTEQCIYVAISKDQTSDIHWFTLCIKPNGGGGTSDHRLVHIPSLPPMPLQGSYVAVGSSIFVMGGFQDWSITSSVSLIDCRSHTAQPLADMPKAVAGSVAQVIDGKIYVIGGANGHSPMKSRSRTMMEFDIETEVWKLKSRLDWEQGKVWFSSVAMGGKIYMRTCYNSFVCDPVTSPDHFVKDEVLHSKEWLGSCVVEDVLFYYDVRGKYESPENNNGDNRSSRDWDKAWKSFKKQSKKTFFSQFNVDKYVTWNPPRSEFPLSEEVDPIKRTERSNLMLWTSPKFTLVGAIVIVSFLLLYTILAPVK